MFNKNVGKRAMAMLMSVLMLGNSVLPAAAADDQQEDIHAQTDTQED